MKKRKQGQPIIYAQGSHGEGSVPLPTPNIETRRPSIIPDIRHRASIFAFFLSPSGRLTG
jgi:hypothetical protein